MGSSQPSKYLFSILSGGLVPRPVTGPIMCVNFRVRTGHESTWSRESRGLACLARCYDLTSPVLWLMRLRFFLSRRHYCTHSPLHLFRPRRHRIYPTHVILVVPIQWPIISRPLIIIRGPAATASSISGVPQ